MKQVELTIVGESHREQRSATRRNPVFEGYLADPFVFRHMGTYYAVGTGPGAAGSEMEFPMLRSCDLVHWERIGCALRTPRLGARNYWAPEVAYSDGQFYLYYSAGVGDAGHELRVAVSYLPQGPFVDTGTALLDPATVGFAIDAHPFRDDDGRWYLFYARDFLDAEPGARTGTALVVAPMPTMTHIAADFRVVMRAHHDWQRFEKDRKIHGGTFDWHTLEGPCVIKRNGRYYCLYSGGNWQNESYGVDYVVADSPLGPYTDTNDGSGPRVLRTIPGTVIGPGHNSAFTGPDGQTYLAYHAWDLDSMQRRMWIDRLEWEESGPMISHR